MQECWKTCEFWNTAIVATNLRTGAPYVFVRGPIGKPPFERRAPFRGLSSRWNMTASSL